MNWPLHNTNGAAYADKLGFVLEHINKAVLLVDGNGKTEYVNEGFCHLFQLRQTPAQIIGGNFTDLLQQLHSRIIKPENIFDFTERTKQNNQKLADTEWILHSGSIIAVEYIPMRKDGKEQTQLWLFKDVSDYKQLINKSEQQQAFYEKVLNNIPADITIYDTNHKYLFANKNAVAKEDMRKWLIGKDDFDYSLSKSEGFEKLFQDVIISSNRCKHIKPFSSKKNM